MYSLTAVFLRTLPNMPACLSPRKRSTRVAARPGLVLDLGRVLRLYSSSTLIKVRALPQLQQQPGCAFK